MSMSFPKLRSATFAFAAACTVAAPAVAADIDSIIYAPEIDRRVPVEVGNGWYLRGDLGYAIEMDGEVGGVLDGEIESDFSGSAGVGYRFTDWFRADATFDYSEGNLDSPLFDVDLAAYGLMANAYADLGTFVGVTPYIGAGIGTTYLEYDSPDVLGVGGRDDWRFTWALMAGASYDLTKSLKLDVGYRYLNVAEGEALSLAGVTVDDDGYEKHEIRAGLRYSLW